MVTRRLGSMVRSRSARRHSHTRRQGLTWCRHPRTVTRSRPKHSQCAAECALFGSWRWVLGSLSAGRSGYGHGGLTFSSESKARRFDPAPHHILGVHSADPAGFIIIRPRRLSVIGTSVTPRHI